MPNIMLTLAYDGADFHGWQIQPGQPTVQGLLSDVLRQLTQERVVVQGAGRTDAGVHAWGQVASFKTSSEMSPARLARGLNALLPPTVRVRDAQEVSSDFHARWDALAKTYVYRIYRAPVVPPFHWRYVHHVPYGLDFGAMSDAARVFEGTHDFSTFAASSGSEEMDQDRDTKRVVFSSEMLGGSAFPAGRETPSLPAHSPDCLPWSLPGPNEWVYRVRGKSFLRHMVRKIVGTLLEVGQGRISPGDVVRLLESRDRALSGPTAPSQGLCLLSVEYADPTNSLSILR
jgi:tRNA pseudouridine38-40 synthase